MSSGEWSDADGPVPDTGPWTDVDPSEVEEWMAAEADEEDDADTERAWLAQIDPERIPKHIAIIMDGNGRWARRRHLPRGFGHVQGAQTAKKIIRACRGLHRELTRAGVSLGPSAQRVEHLTLYTFSNENWSRPADEVTGLMRLIEDQLRANVAELKEIGVRVRLLGRANHLPGSLLDELQRDIAETADNQELVLHLALNYGGRAEIVDAARALAEQAARGELDPAAIDEGLLARHLYAPDVPDPDLLIRTGGEMRLSNFLIWQVAYAELWVTQTLWPAFRPAEVYQAIVEFQTRERRFGGLVTHGS